MRLERSVANLTVELLARAIAPILGAVERRRRSRRGACTCPTKDTLTAGVPNVAHYDRAMGRYYLDVMQSGSPLIMHYCFACGGLLTSRPAHKMRKMDKAELREAAASLEAIKTKEEMLLVLGAPTETLHWKPAPEDALSGIPMWIEQHAYRRLYETFDLFIHVYPGGRLEKSYHRKDEGRGGRG